MAGPRSDASRSVSEDAIDLWAFEPWLSNSSAWTAYDTVDVGRVDPEHDRFVPTFALHESPDSFLIEAPLPGTLASDIDVSADDGSVEVACRRSVDHTTTERAPRFGAFARRIALECLIVRSSLRSSLVDGVLRVTVTKARPA